MHWHRVAVTDANDYIEGACELWAYDYRLYDCAEDVRYGMDVGEYQIVVFKGSPRKYYVRDGSAGEAYDFTKGSCMQPPFKRLRDAQAVVEMLIETEGESP